MVALKPVGWVPRVMVDVPAATGVKVVTAVFAPAANVTGVETVPTLGVPSLIGILKDVPGFGIAL